MLAAFGYDDDIVGSHAGISDTSQMLHVYPPAFARPRSCRGAVRRTRASPAIPTKATAEIGRMGIEFKVNAAIGQYPVDLKPAAPRGGPA